MHSLYFFAALWWGRHLLAFTVAEHRTDAMFCWHITHPYTICHAKQPTPELRPVLHTPKRSHGERMAQDGGAEMVLNCDNNFAT